MNRLTASLSGSAMYPYPGLSENDCNRLIAVDVQNQFVSPKTEHILEGIEAIIPLFQKVVLSLIEHDPAQIVYDLKQWKPAPYGSEGHASALNITPRDAEHLHVTRKTFFSALTDDAFEFLNAKPKDTVYICGMDTDLCVQQTGVDLMKRGLRPVILSDLCASFAGEPLHTHALIQCKRFFGRQQVI